MIPAVRIGHAPSDRIPPFVAEVEDPVFGALVVWAAEDTLPVLEVGPGLFGCRA